MAGWLTRTWGSITAAVTPSTASAPTGKTFVSLAIKSQTTGYSFGSTRAAIEYVKGTVAACMNARASERGVLKFIVQEDGKDTLLSKQIQRVLNRPNPVQSRTDFLEMMSQFHDGCGNAALYFINGDGGMPAEVWCIPSFFIIPIFSDPADPIPSAYQWADGRVTADNGNVCIIRNNSLKTAPWTGRGFLADGIDSAILYDMVVQSQINWFRTGGAPNIALTAPLGTTLTDEQILTIQKLWNEKYNPATGTSNIGILPDGMDVKNFGPNELSFNTSKEEIRDSLREGFQLPKIILGDTDNVNHNNGQTALAMFERLVVLRWGEKVANGLESFFQQNYSSKITVTIDDKVKASFTQLPTQNGVVTMPTTEQFPNPNNPNG